RTDPVAAAQVGGEALPRLPAAARVARPAPATETAVRGTGVGGCRTAGTGNRERGTGQRQGLAEAVRGVASGIERLIDDARGASAGGREGQEVTGSVRGAAWAQVPAVPGFGGCEEAAAVGPLCHAYRHRAGVGANHRRDRARLGDLGAA